MKTLEQKRLEAIERQKSYNRLSVKEKLNRLGDFKAERQRKKLLALS